MKILIIGNPVSGDGRAAQRIGRLVEVLTRRGHVVQAMLTQQAADTQRFAREIRPGQFDRLVVAGGDGTLNGVLNGLTRPDLLPIVPLSSGTANLLARELRLPQHPVALADVLESGIVRRLDMGLINGQRFLLVASAGFDAMVIEEIHRNRGGRLGFRGYPLPIWRVFRRYRQPTFRVRLDDEVAAQTGGMVVVSNTRVYAGILSITDKAVCDSGHWDVCLVPQASTARLLSLALSAFRRRVSARPDLLMREVRERVTLESSEGASVDAVEALARTGRERLEQALRGETSAADGTNAEEHHANDESARVRHASTASTALRRSADMVLAAGGAGADLIAEAMADEPLSADVYGGEDRGRFESTIAVHDAPAHRSRRGHDRQLREAALIPDPIQPRRGAADHAAASEDHSRSSGVRVHPHERDHPGGHEPGDLIKPALDDVRAGEIPIEVDGEYFGHTPAIIEFIPGLVPVVAPRPRLRGRAGSAAH